MFTGQPSNGVKYRERESLVLSSCKVIVSNGVRRCSVDMMGSRADAVYGKPPLFAVCSEELSSNILLQTRTGTTGNRSYPVITVSQFRCTKRLNHR